MRKKTLLAYVMRPLVSVFDTINSSSPSSFSMPVGLTAFFTIVGTFRMQASFLLMIIQKESLTVALAPKLLVNAEHYKLSYD